MGSQKGLAEVEHVGVAKAYIVTTQDPIVGTDQKGKDFYDKMRVEYLEQMKAARALPASGDRTVGAVSKTWHKLKNGVSTVSGHFLAVQRMNVTGNPSEEAVICGALEKSNGH